MTTPAGLSASERERAGWAVVAWMALGGAGWGVAARLWMRFISTDPEFSWSGTLYIVLVPTLIGLLLGLALLARRRRWRQWVRKTSRAVAGGSIVLLGVGAGMSVTSIMFGSLALSRLRYRVWARVALALVLVLFPVVIMGRGGGIWPLVVNGALAVLIVIGRGMRVLLALLAAAPVVVIGGGLIEDLALWKAAVGLLTYLGLLAVAVVGYGRPVWGEAFPGFGRSREVLPSRST